MSPAYEDQNRELTLGSVGNDPVLRTQIAKAWDSFQAGERQLETDRFEQADQRFEEAFGIVSRIMETWTKQGKTTWSGHFIEFTAAIMLEQARAKWAISAGNYHEAVELAQLSRQYFELAHSGDNVAVCWSMLADLHAAFGDVPAAQAAMGEALRPDSASKPVTRLCRCR